MSNSTLGGMDLSFLELAPKKAVPWAKAKLAFLGAERYELFIMDVDVQILCMDGGFKTRFKRPVAVPASLMLGKGFRTLTICDIELRMNELTLSLATINPEHFPKVFEEHQIVGIN